MYFVYITRVLSPSSKAGALLNIKLSTEAVHASGFRPQTHYLERNKIQQSRDPVVSALLRWRKIINFKSEGL